MTVAESGRGPDKNSAELLDLIRRCVAGDESAWAELYRLYNPKLRAWTRKYNSFRDHVDDILQDSWCNLMARGAKVLATYVPRPEVAFDSWLYVVHRRFCLQWFEREAAQRNLLHGDPVETLDSLPRGVCEDSMALLGFLPAYRTLQAREQEIFSLHLAGYSHGEIGDRYTLTANNIGVILYRVRDRLRTQWGGAV